VSVSQNVILEHLNQAESSAESQGGAYFETRWHSCLCFLNVDKLSLTVFSCFTKCAIINREIGPVKNTGRGK